MATQPDESGNGIGIPTREEMLRRLVHVEQDAREVQIELSGSAERPGLRETVRKLVDSMARVESKANTVISLLAIIAIAASAVAVNVWTTWSEQRASHVEAGR